LRHAAKLCIVVACAMASGCSLLHDKPVPPPPLEYSINSPYRSVHTIAIAPAVNLSGNHDFDVLAVSDSLFEEMQQVRNLNALPLNKTLIVMRKLNMRSIDTPQDAQVLIKALGADAIIIPAVTAYDPYNPPVVGMTLQLYSLAGAEPAVSGGGVGGPEHQPVSQVSAVFNASNQTVLHELRDFAAGRTEYETALQDEKFLVDSDSYMRFVSHAMIRRLMEAERQRNY